MSKYRSDLTKAIKFINDDELTKACKVLKEHKISLADALNIFFAETAKQNKLPVQSTLSIDDIKNSYT